jgi:hypothetical protein
MPPIGGTVLNTVEMVAKIEAWQRSRASAHPGRPTPAPARTRVTILHDDDSSSECDADPIPLEQLQMEEMASSPVVPPAMELEPDGEEEGSDLGDDDEDFLSGTIEEAQTSAPNVQFVDDEEELLP